MKKTLTILTALLLGGLSLVHGQIPPNVNPKKLLNSKELQKKLAEHFEKLPTKTEEYKGVKLTYKKVPADLTGIAKKIAKDRGLNVSDKVIRGYVRQYGGKLENKLNELCQNIGTLKTDKPLRWGRKKIKPGTYQLGIQIKKFNLYRVFIWKKVKKKKRVYLIPLSKRIRQKKTYKNLVVKSYPHKKKEEIFRLAFAYGKLASISRFCKILGK